MDIILKGKRVFIQSYNPGVIMVSERKPKNQIVYRVYSSMDSMKPSDGAAYRVAVARKLNSFLIVNVKGQVK